MSCCVGEQAEHHQRGERRGATGRQQGQLDTGDRQEADNVADVDQCLGSDQHGDGCGQQSQERVYRARGDAQTHVREKSEQEQDDNATDESELFTDDREDEVVVGVREIVPFGATLAESFTEDTSIGEGVTCLSRLISRALRVVDVSEEALHALTSVPGGHRQDTGRDHTGGGE